MCLLGLTLQRYAISMTESSPLTTCYNQSRRKLPKKGDADGRQRQLEYKQYRSNAVYYTAYHSPSTRFLLLVFDARSSHAPFQQSQSFGWHCVIFFWRLAALAPYDRLLIHSPIQAANQVPPYLDNILHLKNSRRRCCYKYEKYVVGCGLRLTACNYVESSFMSFWRRAEATRSAVCLSNQTFDPIVKRKTFAQF